MPTYQLLTDRSLAESTAITPTTLIHIVTTADTRQNSSGSSYKAQLSQLSGIFGGNFTGGTVSGNTNFTNGLTANTISATTYYNLPTDVRVTGGTYSAGTITFTNNTGGTFNVTGLTTGSTSTISGDYLPLSGGTVTGSTTFTNGLTANTISATTYYNLPLGNYGTGLTFNTGTYDLSLDGGNGVLDTISLSVLSSDMTVTGGTYNPVTGTATFTNNSGGTFPVTGFLVGYTDTLVTGATYSNNTFTFRNNTGGTFNVLFNTVTGLTSTGAISANTISATTYQNTPATIQVACSDEVTALVTGNTTTFRMPYNMFVTEVRASLTTAQTAGSTFTVDILNNGSTILSTLITIDNTLKTSKTSAVQPVLSTVNLVDDSEMVVKITQIGNGTARGLKVTILGKRS